MIYVEDDYFSDPYNIRNVAIKNIEKFNIDTNFLWPGMRWINGVEDSVKNKILKTTSNISHNSVFSQSKFHYQIIGKEYCEGSIHRDHSKYTALIFLNPNPPSDSGIEIYERKDDNKILINYNLTQEKQKFMKSSKNFLDRFTYYNKLKKVSQLFEQPSIISNKFNRLVIFNSELYHSAQKYFGNSSSNSRLTIIGFIS